MHTRMLELTMPLAPPPPCRPAFPCQRRFSTLYMTLHRHSFNFDSMMFHTPVQDGDQPALVPAGWQIAEGNQEDIFVCGSFSWQSRCLVFANGQAYGTGMVDYPHRPRTCRRALLLFRNPKNSDIIFCLTPDYREQIRQ
jgi:hypothetical protein